MTKTIAASEISTFQKILEIYCFNLVLEASLIEVIKKDEINSAENASLKIQGESDIDRAERILSFSKQERSDKNSLLLLRYDMYTIAASIKEHLSSVPFRFTYYSFKREGYKDLVYRFHITSSGELLVRLL